LVDVALARQEERPLADVSKFDYEVARQFSLYRQGPVVGGRVLKNRVLHGQTERKFGHGRAGRVACQTVLNANQKLQRRVAA
jgi:hypothetical protein